MTSSFESLEISQTFSLDPRLVGQNGPVLCQLQTSIKWMPHTLDAKTSKPTQQHVGVTATRSRNHINGIGNRHAHYQ